MGANPHARQVKNFHARACINFAANDFLKAHHDERLAPLQNTGFDEHGIGGSATPIARYSPIGDRQSHAVSCACEVHRVPA